MAVACFYDIIIYTYNGRSMMSILARLKNAGDHLWSYVRWLGVNLEPVMLDRYDGFTNVAHELRTLSGRR